jgi:hypothetical protein
MPCLWCFSSFSNIHRYNTQQKHRLEISSPESVKIALPKPKSLECKRSFRVGSEWSPGLPTLSCFFRVAAANDLESCRANFFPEDKPWKASSFLDARST